MRSLRVLFASAVSLGLIAGTAGATGISSGIPYELQVWIGGNYYDLGDVTHTFTPSADGGTYLMTSDAVTPFGTITDWTSTYNIDPQVTNNFTVVNTTLVTQIFTVSVTSPIAPVLPTSLMRGSLGITLTDEGPLDGFGDTDGVALLESNSPTAVYRAFLDGSPVPTTFLFPDPYTLTCTPFNCSTSDSDSFGIPVRIPGPGATLSMGITVQFELSPGDSAAVTSVFNIIPVPEPSTAVTFGLGLVGLAIAGRRRSE